MMNQFFRAFGNNKISLKTDKGYYVSGELVTGKIRLKLETDIVCRGVMFKVTGYEKAEWEETRTESYEVEVERDGIQTTETNWYDEIVEHEGKKEFFKERIRVSDAVEMIPAGEHEFPFQYQLPNGLPGVFDFDHDQPKTIRERGGGSHDHDLKCKAKIVYKLKCYIDCARAKDLKAKQHLVVHELIDSNIAPSKDHIVANVMLCCCIPRGECEMTAYFDKNKYAPGETAQCFAQVDNRSKSDVGEMSVKLMRTIRLRNKHGHDYHLTSTVLAAEYEGVPALTNGDRNMPLALLPGLQPSTNGGICHCNYHFDVECNISHAPDIELHMPMVLYAPPPMQWGIPM